MHEMLYAKGENWNNLPTYLKRGRCIVRIEEEIEIKNDCYEGKVIRNRWTADLDIPIFMDDRNYILSRMEDEKKA